MPHQPGSRSVKHRWRLVVMTICSHLTITGLENLHLKHIQDKFETELAVFINTGHVNFLWDTECIYVQKKTQVRTKLRKLNKQPITITIGKESEFKAKYEYCTGFRGQ